MSDRQRESETILCATDFSSTAVRALGQAMQLAERRGARVVLVHVMEPLPVGPDPLLPSAPIAEEEIRQHAEARLQAEAERVDQGDVRLDVRIEMGVPGNTHVRLAADLGADLIVIGTRGLSGLQHLLLGSTAEFVVRRASCPVLTIHPDDRSEIGSARRVVVPTDLSEDAAAAIETFVERFGPEDLPEILLAFADSTPPYFDYMTHERLARYRQEDTRRKEIEERMRPLEEDLRGRGFEVEKWVLDGSPVEAITGLAEREGADLIVMSTHGHSALLNAFLGRTAQRVVQRAPCPVLTVCPQSRHVVEGADR